MKGLLLDENIPNRLTFTPTMPVFHVTGLGESLSDSFVWQYAKENEYVILTKDADFFHRVLLSEPPPWVIHLRIGNMRKRDFHAFLARVWPRIEALLPHHRLINVYLDRIEAIR